MCITNLLPPFPHTNLLGLPYTPPGLFSAAAASRQGDGEGYHRPFENKKIYSEFRVWLTLPPKLELRNENGGICPLSFELAGTILLLLPRLLFLWDDQRQRDDANIGINTTNRHQAKRHPSSSWWSTAIDDGGPAFFNSSFIHSFDSMVDWNFKFQIQFQKVMPSMKIQPTTTTTTSHQCNATATTDVGWILSPCWQQQGTM